MIRQTGDYPSPSGRWVLKVRKAEKALRPYWIENVETQTSFKSDRTLSDAMRWGLLWEGDTRLWCYSGDIGTCVWTLDDKDVWTQHWGPYDQKFYQSMPTEVFDYLPPNKKQKLIAKGWTPAAINEK